MPSEDEVKEALEKFKEASEALESIDASLLRNTERHMRESALKSITHSIARLDTILEMHFDEESSLKDGIGEEQ